MEVKKGIYKHFKGGIYRVIGVGKHSESLDEMVVYQSVSDGGIWVRPVAMWDEKVERDGKILSRFQYIGDEENLDI